MDEGSVHDTLILSDLHLGSECSRAREATQLLKKSHFRRLILLGDIFANLDFRRLTKEQWKFLGQIRKLSNPKRNIEIVWVEGNHDEGLTEIMAALVGVQVYQEYAWEYAGVQHLAIHGHQFDRFVVNNLRLNHFWTVIYLKLQKFDLKGKPVARFIDRLNTRWLRMSSKVALGALAHARERGAERIFCGHTHVAMAQKQNGIDYYNSGAWVDSEPTYITIGPGGAQIREYRAEGGKLGDDADETGSAVDEFGAEPATSEDNEYEDVRG